ncbi:RnfH family protein [Alteromonas sp. LMIT006]|uniref:RnfH family protein n=1 Tax=Alteromonadaceae TaxID=72275 RepID=UPI0020CA3A10|nr:RnfH family protein [Alteromonas sp. LMIT006]UTP72450.1 RnfH family protein [Alteromonas sp. LMIT006]
MQKLCSVEVVYGTPDKQEIVTVEVPAETSVEECITQSNIQHIFPEIDLSENKVGIWNRACRLKDMVKDGDRIEIYRPLIADPKEVRRLRAEKAKAEGRANKVTGGRPLAKD